jgi:hypothetical protein
MGGSVVNARIRVRVDYQLAGGRLCSSCIRTLGSLLINVARAAKRLGRAAGIRKAFARRDR